MAGTQLTPGAVPKFFTLSQSELADFHPVVQINAVKAADASKSKYKLLVSDGSHYVTAVSVGAELKEKIEKDEIGKHTVLRVMRCSCHNTPTNGGKPLLLIVDVSVLDKPTEKIGNPQKMEESEIRQLTAGGTITSTNNTAGRPTNAMAAGGMTGTQPSTQVYPIASLNPYQNKWTIKARVSKKGDIRTWNNARGEGKLFSCDLMDESGEIRCTGFTDAVEKFYNIIEQGSVYYVSRCTLKTANKQYTSIKNDYEMTINNDTSIVKCDDADDVPQMQMNYTDISNLESHAKDAFVDVIGIATEVGDISSITARATGKQLTKREVKLQDKSGAAVSLTLWGSDAEKFDANMMNPVISIKAAKVSDFGGRSLSVSFSSTMMVNPSTEESHALRGWYEKEGKDQTPRNMSSSQGGMGAPMETPFKTFQEIQTANIQDKPEYFSSQSTVIFVKKDNCMYKACPSDDCNKKVIQESDAEFRCEKCNKLYPNFNYRLMLTVKLADYSGCEWVTCFQESAEKLLNVTAADLGQMRDENEAEFDKTMNRINFTSHNFKLRARMDTYMDETRVKCTALSVDKIDWSSQSKKILEEIRALEG